MSNKRTAVEVLPPRFIPEFTIHAPTGYAATENGEHCVLRTVTNEALELRLIIPTDQIDAVIMALQAAKQVAKAKQPLEADDGKMAMFVPETYHTVTTPHYSGVILIFNKDQESQQVIGLDREAARQLGKGLIAQAQEVAGARKIITPNKDLIT
jgi:hypothetical protein